MVERTPSGGGRGGADGRAHRAAHAEGALRAELEALRTARDRAVRAEAEARSARRAELEALAAAGDRLRPADVASIPDGLILDLGRAAERLRHGVMAAEVPRALGVRRLMARLRGR